MTLREIYVSPTLRYEKSLEIITSSLVKLCSIYQELSIHEKTNSVNFCKLKLTYQITAHSFQYLCFTIKWDLTFDFIYL